MEKLKWAGARARAMAETAKRSAELAEANEVLRRVFCDLGEACYAGDEAGVARKREEIAAVQARMNSLAEAIDELRNERRCMRCGRIQSKENRYCAQCGAVLQTKDAEILWPETTQLQTEEESSGEEN